MIDPHALAADLAEDLRDDQLDEVIAELHDLQTRRWTRKLTDQQTIVIHDGAVA